MADLSVFLLEDDAATRANLENKIRAAAGLRLLGSAGSLADARSCLDAALPDALLVDLQLPDGDATKLIADYTAAHPALPILVISVFGDEQRVVRALRAGAQGYLLKDDSGDDLAASIRALCAGLSPISPAIARHLIRSFQTPDRLVSDDATAPDGAALALSEREREVLKLASKGLTYQETAEVLGVTVNTVGTYTRRIYTKLAVNSRSEALFEARQLGLMGDD
ncbi:MAG: response regulator transcription factor [Pseudomonadota bacterium]